MTISQEEIDSIRELAAKANAAGSTSAQMGIERCRLCVAVGDKLRAWKAVVPHGEFGQIRDSIGVTKFTASKWMRASASVEDGKVKLDDVNGIRQLYILLGIVPRKTPDASKPPAKPAEVSHITLAGRLIDSLQSLDLTGWTILRRKTLADILRPIVDFHRKL
jgi:hypothetical protein